MLEPHKLVETAQHTKLDGNVDDFLFVASIGVSAHVYCIPEAHKKTPSVFRRVVSLHSTTDKTAVFRLSLSPLPVYALLDIYVPENRF